MDVGCPERAFELPDETNIEMGPAENWDKLRGGDLFRKGRLGSWFSFNNKPENQDKDVLEEEDNNDADEHNEED